MPARSDSRARWHTRASSPSDRSPLSIQTSIAPKTAAAMQRDGHRDAQSVIRCRVLPPNSSTATALQLGLNGIGEVGLDFLDMADDAARVQLAVP